ncbi:hypothetical protein QFC21_006645 [Naganishia friedmannii]|uniref:Uncharacterized protein n=1 Tax=Naganishia friedmannii TaxID=89922 RepID=A0ACC2V0S7_9TREE|nr:hypothetical protein QFC21_006645 [Naganishia friedmannii]
MSSSSAATVQPASAIPPDLLADLSESPTAGADIHEIVQSPDMMSEGAFPSRPTSVDGFGSTGEARWQEARLMHTVTREDGADAHVASPFPLQGPINHDPLSFSSDTSATTPSTAPSDVQLDTPVAPNAAGSSPSRFPSVRKAPDSPSQSPSVSRRTSSQEVPSLTSHLQQPQHLTLFPADTDSPASAAADDELEHRTSNPALTDSAGSGMGNSHAVPNSSGIPGGRTRRPSTLIPQPGKEKETIPPRYRAEEGVTEAMQGNKEVKAESDGKVLDTTPTADTDATSEPHSTAGGQDTTTTTTTTAASDTTQDNDEENTTTTPPVREPRVVVRDFGFPSHDPRYRGAFHPIPGEAEDNASDEEEDEDDARSTASGASSGWNRFTSGAGRVRRKSSLGAGAGGWSGFGFGGFGAAVVRRFSKSSASGSGSGRRGSMAGLSTAGSTSDALQENGAGSRRGSAVHVVGTSTKSPGRIMFPTPSPRDTDADTDIPTSLSDLTPTPSSNADDDDDDDDAVRAEGGGGGYAFGSGPIPCGAQGGEEGARLSILSQVSEEGGFPQSDSSEDEGGTNNWPDSSTTGNTTNSTSTSGTGTTVTAREPRGRYKVLYEFEAEGNHEMSVREGEILIVGGRWGSMGWVIAERVETSGDEGQKKGLVPEGYLGERLD